MSTFAARKVLAALPDPLAPDTVYYVRTGTGFDTYVTDSNAIAYKANVGGGGVIPVHVKTGTDDAMQPADAGCIVELPNGGTITIDPGYVGIGTAGLIRQSGATPFTAVAASGATALPAGARTSSGQGTLLTWQCASAALVYINGETA